MWDPLPSYVGVGNTSLQPDSYTCTLSERSARSLGYPKNGEKMALGKNDLILRDRFQFTLNSDGEIDTVYGRLDMSDFVNVTEQKGFRVKDIVLQIRDPNNVAGGVANTGNWQPAGDGWATLGSDAYNAWKITVGSRAYESLSDVGIASPDILHVETWTQWMNYPGAGEIAQVTEHNIYPMRDLAPGGYTVVSDILVGVSVDTLSTNDTWDDGVIEIDLMVIGKPTSVTQKAMTQLLVQAQDL